MHVPAVEKRFLTWEACPVTSSYVKCLVAETPQNDFMYSELRADILQLTEDHSHHVAGNRSTQMYRAFYCLSSMSKQLLHLVEDPGSPRFEYTWEGLTRYIEHIRKLEEGYSVQAVLTAFKLRSSSRKMDPNPFSGVGDPGDPEPNEGMSLGMSVNKLHGTRAEKNAEKAREVLEAAEFLRPKLRNGECVGRIGAMMARAFLTYKVSGGTMKDCMHGLLNISRAPMDWTPPTGGERG